MCQSLCLCHVGRVGQRGVGGDPFNSSILRFPRLCECLISTSSTSTEGGASVPRRSRDSSPEGRMRERINGEEEEEEERWKKVERAVGFVVERDW